MYIMIGSSTLVYCNRERVEADGVRSPLDGGISSVFSREDGFVSSYNFEKQTSRIENGEYRIGRLVRLLNYVCRTYGKYRYD